jgi:hypothetical protein
MFNALTSGNLSYKNRNDICTQQTLPNMLFLQWEVVSSHQKKNKLEDLPLSAV